MQKPPPTRKNFTIRDVRPDRTSRRAPAAVFSPLCSPLPWHTPLWIGSYILDRGETPALRGAKNRIHPAVRSGKPGHRVRWVILCRPLMSYQRTLRICPPLRFLRLRGQTRTFLFCKKLFRVGGGFAGGRKRDSGRTKSARGRNCGIRFWIWGLWQDGGRE